MPRSVPKKKTFYYAKYVRKSTEELDSRSIQNQDTVLDKVVEQLILTDPSNEYLYVDTYCDM